MSKRERVVPVNDAQRLVIMLTTKSRLLVIQLERLIQRTGSTCADGVIRLNTGSLDLRHAHKLRHLLTPPAPEASSRPARLHARVGLHHPLPAVRS